jgi:hypothetical protein
MNLQELLLVKQLNIEMAHLLHGLALVNIAIPE